MESCLVNLYPEEAGMCFMLDLRTFVFMYKRFLLCKDSIWRVSIYTIIHKISMPVYTLLKPWVSLVSHYLGQKWRNNIPDEMVDRNKDIMISITYILKKIFYTCFIYFRGTKQGFHFVSVMQVYHIHPTLGCALTFASEAKFEIEAKILFPLEAKKKPDFTWFTSMRNTEKLKRKRR